MPEPGKPPSPRPADGGPERTAGANGNDGAPAGAPLPGLAAVVAAPDRPDPGFEIVSAEPVPRSSAPTLRFRLEVGDESGIALHFIALTVLITVEPGMRSYDPVTRDRLVELFGEPERWGSTTGAFRWTQVDRVVPGFSGEGAFDLDVPCTYDHEIAATKYFGGIEDGAYPLRFHFNGTTYYEGDDGRLQILPLAWDRSARFELPVAVWRQMIDAHYPRGGWLRLTEETLRDLGRHKAASGAPTMDECVRALLEGAAGEEPS